MKKQLIFGILMFVSISLFAQERLYINDYGEEVSKEEATLFREIKEENGLYHIKDYYVKTEKLQMSVTTRNKNFTEVKELEGDFVFYHEDGKISMKGKESKGIVKGINYDEKGKKTAEYTYNLPENSYEYTYFSQNESDINSTYYYQNDQLAKLIRFGEDIKKAREEYFYEGENLSKIDYYDEKGKKIGTNYEYTSNRKRTEVLYYYNPMRVKIVAEFDEKDRLMHQTMYYPNGKIFSKEERKDGEAVVNYFNKSGKQIANFTAKNNDDVEDFYQPYEGTEMTINNLGQITSVTDYRLGKKIKSVNYYSELKEVKKSEEEYDIDGYQNYVVFYNKKGKEISRVIYQDGMPYSGTFYEDIEKNETSTVYEEGKEVFIKKYDDKNTLRLQKKLDNTQYFCESFDEKGQKMYEYMLISDGYNNSIISIHQYENGKIVRTAKLTDGIISEGSILLTKKNFTFEKEEPKKEVLIEKKSDFIQVTNKINGKTYKESKIFLEYLRDDDENYDLYNEIRIREGQLTEFSF